ncbi:MAG: ATP-binding cassette domain-containing protein [Oscillospiraceae bacterium]
MLEICDLHVHFHGSDHEAVRGIDLTVGDGEIVGLVGESGSGKTVTAMMISGLLRPEGILPGEDPAGRAGPADQQRRHPAQHPGKGHLRGVSGAHERHGPHHAHRAPGGGVPAGTHGPATGRGGSWPCRPCGTWTCRRRRRYTGSIPTSCPAVCCSGP